LRPVHRRNREPFRTIIEPFRIHSVEPMRRTTRAARATALAAAGYSLFELQFMARHAQRRQHRRL
jgi:tryptophanase